LGQNTSKLSDLPVFAQNIYYTPAGSKIVFANGSQDPWRHASKQKSSKESKDVQSFVPF
jgi:hypothetical protein